jgi:restriction endonuclease Mrr
MLPDRLVAHVPTLTQRAAIDIPSGQIAFADLVPALALCIPLAGLAVVGVRRIRRAPVRTHTLPELLSMTPAAFAEAVASLLRAQGYAKVTLVGEPDEQAATLVARDAQGRRVVVHCQRDDPAQRIGRRLVHKFLSRMQSEHQAQVGIFVTTACFSDPALELARQSGLILLDGSDLRELMAEPTQRRQLLPPAA